MNTYRREKFLDFSVRGEICEREGESGYFCKKGVKSAILGSLRVGEVGKILLCSNKKVFWLLSLE